MATVNVQQYIDVEVEMSDIDTDDLVDELTKRLKRKSASLKGVDFEELVTELSKRSKIDGFEKSTVFDEIVSEHISEVLKKYTFAEIQKALPL